MNDIQPWDCPRCGWTNRHAKHICRGCGSDRRSRISTPEERNNNRVRFIQFADSMLKMPTEIEGLPGVPCHSPNRDSRLWDDRKGYAHIIYNTEIGTLKNKFHQHDPATNLLDEIGTRDVFAFHGTGMLDTTIRWVKIHYPKHDKPRAFGSCIEMGYIGAIPIAEVTAWHRMEGYEKNPFQVHVFLPFRSERRNYCNVEDEGQYREAPTKDEIHRKAQVVVDRWFAQLRETQGALR